MKAIAVAMTVFAVGLNQAATGEADAPAPREEAPDATPAPGETQRPDAPDATATGTGKAANGPAAESEPDAARQAPPEDAAHDVFVPSEDISEDLSVRFPVDI